MSRLCLYYRREPDADRWLVGDRYARGIARRLIRGTPRMGGIDKVFLNLRLGLDRLGIEYYVNLPFAELGGDDRVGVLGRGRHCLQGYTRANPIVAGIALMTHPSEWPTLCRNYPVARYLQHSEWAANVYRPYFGDRVGLWPVGIDTDRWIPSPLAAKPTDFLIYDKIHWDRDTTGAALLDQVHDALRSRGLTWKTLRYGEYNEAQFQERLAECRAMIFLSEHESQGIAYQECLSSDVPVLAWDQGRCQDPQRFEWGQPEIPTTSVPFFDHRCGLRFRGAGEFAGRLDEFVQRLAERGFAPRQYVLENLTLERCSAHFVAIVDAATGRRAA